MSRGKKEKSRLDKGREHKTLATIQVNQRAKITKLLVKGQTRRRLLDLGLLPGTEVKAVMKSPLGNPVAYDIRGSMFALRLEDASRIVVELLSS